MRLNLYWRGRDVIDVEVHVWKRREDDAESDVPTLSAGANLQDVSRAEPMDPDTAAFGFGVRS